MAAGNRSGHTRRSGHGDVLTVVLVVALVAGLAMVAYPYVSNWWNSRHQTSASAAYEQSVTSSGDEQVQAMWDAAVAYNQTLLTQTDRYHPTSEQMREYLSLLDPSGNGVMGQVVIPKLGLDLPIYHSTDADVLAAGIGHIPGSSLPVGGDSTHCVISGHRGVPTSELFTNIDQLTEGDTFELHVLGRTLTYEVDQIRIVLPDEVSDLAIEQGRDLCTLVTCTPYGVNTHRLLVRGHRVANAAGGALAPADAVQVDVPTTAVALAAAIAVVAWVVYLLVERHMRRERSAVARARDALGLAPATSATGADRTQAPVRRGGKGRARGL